MHLCSFFPHVIYSTLLRNWLWLFSFYRQRMWNNERRLDLSGVRLDERWNTERILFQVDFPVLYVQFICDRRLNNSTGHYTKFDVLKPDCSENHNAAGTKRAQETRSLRVGQTLWISELRQPVWQQLNTDSYEDIFISLAWLINLSYILCTAEAIFCFIWSQWLVCSVWN